jgi:ubiquinone/menaquinone biosynthesis C-methylase UbiE
VIALLLAAASCQRQSPAVAPAPTTAASAPTPAPTSRPAAPVYELRPASRDGIGKFYMGREIAQVMGHPAADWLERKDREETEKPSRAIELMDFKPTDVVADIGAGTGYFSFRIALLVPQGKVLAEDIQPEMLEIIRKTAASKGVKNVEPVLGTITDPNFPAGSIDKVLFVDAYHEFDHPWEMMQAIVKSLKPSGQVILVEYRGEDPNVPIKALHKMTEAQAIKEMSAVGLRHVRTIEELPQQHLMIFAKP